MVFSLGEWSPQLPTGFHVSCGTQDTASVSAAFRLRDYHPLWMPFPEHSAIMQCSYLCGPTTPTLTHNASIQRQRYSVSKKLFTADTVTNNWHSVLESVWALPLSLAATEGISLDFFSSGY